MPQLSTPHAGAPYPAPAYPSHTLGEQRACGGRAHRCDDRSVRQQHLCFTRAAAARDGGERGG
eukprot:1544209-Rhodomonas_salina.1